jgi:hypothetical protein
MITLTEQMDAARKMIKDHLTDACIEILEWHDHGLLRNGVVRQAAALITLNKCDNLKIIENMVNRFSMEYLAKNQLVCKKSTCAI